MASRNILPNASRKTNRRNIGTAMPEPTSRTLKKSFETFGISRLRPGQHEVIENLLQGHDTLAIMPTGSGKSLCYQIPALDKPGTTVVVSPLISLMKDQAGKLEDAGVNATQLNSALSDRQQEDALRCIRQLV